MTSHTSNVCKIRINSLGKVLLHGILGFSQNVYLRNSRITQIIMGRQPRITSHSGEATQDRKSFWWTIQDHKSFWEEIQDHKSFWEEIQDQKSFWEEIQDHKSFWEGNPGSKVILRGNPGSQVILERKSRITSHSGKTSQDHKSERTSQDHVIFFFGGGG